MVSTNWAGNVDYAAPRFEAPTSLRELQELVAGAVRVRVRGTGHSFNAAADSSDLQLSLARMPEVFALDEASRRVTVNAAMTYGEVSRRLHARGFALHNLASLPHISVGGSVSTGTHGSGASLGSLATAVVGLEVCGPEGVVRSFSRGAVGAGLFEGMVVGLGAVGVVVAVALEVEPAFHVRQDVLRGLPFSALQGRFAEVMGAGYSVSAFTDWRGDEVQQLWIKSKVLIPSGAVQGAPGGGCWGAVAASGQVHPIEGGPPESCTAQGGEPGPWHERLPHFRPEFTPSHGEELQSEYFVPVHHAPAALRAVRALAGRLAPLLLVSEVRTVAADNLWLSPCYGQNSAALHFTWRREEAALRRLLPALEAALEPHGARPHWGKVFTTPPERLRALYPRFPDFARLLRQLDPGGKFTNEWMEGVLGVARGAGGGGGAAKL